MPSPSRHDNPLYEYAAATVADTSHEDQRQRNQRVFTHGDFRDLTRALVAEFAKVIRGQSLQMDILSYRLCGLSSQDIADRMGISRSTVDYHLRQAARKSEAVRAWLGR